VNVVSLPSHDDWFATNMLDYSGNVGMYTGLTILHDPVLALFNTEYDVIQ
jgi:hypothetical protein